MLFCFVPVTFLQIRKKCLHSPSLMNVILSRSRLCRCVREWRDSVALLPALVFNDPLWNMFRSNAFFGTVDVHELHDSFCRGW